MAAGFVGVMVGFTSSAVLVFPAASAAGASTEEISSWIFALGMSIAITCIGLSLRYKTPILTGWSTPGAAVLITSLVGVPMPEAIGAFIFSAILTILVGVTGVFEKLIMRIPHSLSSAMLAGILMQFGINVFVSMEHEFTLVSTMLISYLIGKRFFPRSVILVVLLVGIVLAGNEGLFHGTFSDFSIATPILTLPKFSFATMISIGIPLFLVTMTSQNIPGLAVLNESGYTPPISPLISLTGLVTLLFAPFGCYSVNLAAISAAICTGEEADINPLTRYRSTIFAGLCWFLIAIFGSTVVQLFSVFPHELILSIAGLALIGSIGSTLKGALENQAEREPAIITLLISASGITLFGMGSAFIGIITGSLSLAVLLWRKNKKTKLSPIQTTISDKLLK